MNKAVILIRCPLEDDEVVLAKLESKKSICNEDKNEDVCEVTKDSYFPWAWEYTEYAHMKEREI